MPKAADIEGAERFAGEVYFTSTWPHEGVDFTGKRVAVIGTGSSGIQSIPLIAEQAAQLTVFQRTPNFSVPAHNGAVRPEKRAPLEADRDEYREQAKWSRGGIPFPIYEFGALQLSEEDGRARLESAWEAGELFEIIGVFNDVLINRTANEVVADYIRGQDPIDRGRPRDGRGALPERSPLRHQAAVSRHQLLRHVQPAARPPRRPAQAPDRDDHRDRHRHRRRSIRVRRHRVRHRFRRDDGRPRLGRHHRARRRDAQGEVGPRPHHLPRSHHGRVPELLHDHRPGKPFGAVEHDGVDRAARRLGGRMPRRHARARRHGDRAHRDGGSRLGAARERLRRHHALPHRQLVVHGRQRAGQAAGVPAVRRRCRRVPGGVRRGQEQRLLRVPAHRPRGFTLQRRCSAPPAARRDDGARSDGRAGTAAVGVDVGRRRPGVRRRMAEQSPPGPDVGEIVDGVLPGAGGDLAYRLYRPPSDGPHPIVVYFHGGGWVLGGSQLRRSAVPRPVRAFRCRHRVGRLPPRPGGSLPRRRRRRVRRRPVDRRPHRRARWRARPACGVRMERRWQHRRRRLPAGA